VTITASHRKENKADLLSYMDREKVLRLFQREFFINNIPVFVKANAP
jgi:hypothetical protein